MFTILRAFTVFVESSLSIVKSELLSSRSEDDGYDGSSANVHLGQKKVNESWSMRLP